MVDSLVEHLNGPHEWGYRDPVVGGFIADDAPFRAADRILALEAQLVAARSEEREACAKVAEAEARDCKTGTIEHSTAWAITDAIRALGGEG